MSHWVSKAFDADADCISKAFDADDAIQRMQRSTHWPRPEYLSRLHDVALRDAIAGLRSPLAIRILELVERDPVPLEDVCQALQRSAIKLIGVM